MDRNQKQLRIQEMWMTDARQAHPNDELIERYALGRLDEPELGEVEEHVLVCPPCQDRVAEAEEFGVIMRAAAANVATEAPREAWWRRWLPAGGLTNVWMPAPALAAALVMMVSLGVWQPWRASAPAEWRTVELETLRGGEEKAGAVAGYALELRLDVSGIDPTGATGQIVNTDGSVIAETALTLTGGKAVARYEAGLRPGRYWVRVKKNGETVREYSLPVGEH